MLPQSLAGQRELQWFEKSGEFLSSVRSVCVTMCACISLGDQPSVLQHHAAIEEICSGHSDVMEIMKERAEVGVVPVMTLSSQLA